MKEDLEKQSRRVEGETVFDSKYGHFKEVVRYKDRGYDLREMLPNGNGWYRMTSEHRYDLPEPSYIEVDKDGNVVKESN